MLTNVRIRFRAAKAQGEQSTVRLDEAGSAVELARRAEAAL
jgi:hypothetical protein